MKQSYELSDSSVAPAESDNSMALAESDSSVAPAKSDSSMAARGIAYFVGE